MNPIIGDILRAHGCPVDPVPAPVEDQAEPLRRLVAEAAAGRGRRRCCYCRRDMGPAAAGIVGTTDGICTFAEFPDPCLPRVLADARAARERWSALDRIADVTGGRIE